MYLLPAIDILGGRAVRLAKGDYQKVTVYHDDPVVQAQIFEEAGATWLHVVDLDGARSGISENIAIIEAILKKTLLKLEVGGGIRSIEAIDRLYQAGAARVVLGTSLIANPAFIEQALSRYPQLLAAGIDAKDGEVAIEGWREGAGVPAEELVAHVADLGFKHLIYTDIARDGMQTGIDADLYVRIAEIFNGPVIASGGVASIEDIKNLAKVASSIEGVIAGRAMYEKSIDIGEAIVLCAQATKTAQAASLSFESCGGCSC